MGQHKNKRKRLTKIRHIVQPPTPDDFTQEELWGVPDDPLRPGRAFLCRDDIEQRMRIVAPEPKPDGLVEEILAEFDMPDWMD